MEMDRTYIHNEKNFPKEIKDYLKEEKNLLKKVYS